MWAVGWISHGSELAFMMAMVASRFGWLAWVACLSRQAPWVLKQ